MPDFTPDYITQAPVIGEDRVREVLHSEFGLDAAVGSVRITPLTGYDDLNFLVEVVVEAGSQPSQVPVGKYVLKFSNPMESAVPGLIDSQNVLMDVLREHGIPTPQVIQVTSSNNNKADGWALVQMTEGVALPARLFTFLPGQAYELLPDSTPSLHRCIGQLLARVHTSWDSDQRLAHDSVLQPLKQHYTFMAFENLDILEAEVGTLAQLPSTHPSHLDEGRQKLCLAVFQEFRERLVARKGEFRHGIVHSDFNEANVLLAEGPENGTGEGCRVSGLLDFGDAYWSLRLFDFSNAVLYLLLHSANYQAILPDGGDLLARLRSIVKELVVGYKSVPGAEAYPFWELEECLVLCMKARIAISLVYGRRTVRVQYRQGEDGTYILRTQRNGWSLLEGLSALGRGFRIEGISGN